MPLQVCHLWMVVSNCIPGSPQMYVPSAILRSSVRASFVSHGLPSVHAARPPFVAFDRRVHEFVAHPHAEIFVLVHDRAVGVAVVTAVVTLLDQRPGFLLFLLLRVDEFLDVRMPILERVHLRGAPRFAAALHHVRDLVVDLEERKRPARFAAAAQFFPRDLSEERSVPVPLPYLNSIASLVARRMMSSIVSSTLWMKQALPCGYSYCVGARSALPVSRL